MKIGQYLAKIWTRVYCAVFLAHPVYSLGTRRCLGHDATNNTQRG